MNNILPADTSTVLLLLLLASMAAAYLMLGFGGFAGSKKKAPVQKKSKSFWRSVLLMLFLAVSALVLLFFAVYLHYFIPLNDETRVARVEFEKDGGRKGDFRMILIPYENGQPGKAQSYPIKGAAWSLKGEVLHWQPGLGKVGLRTMFRLTGIDGYYGQGSSARKGSEVKLTGTAGQGIWKAVQGTNRIFKAARITTHRSGRKNPLWSSGYDIYASEDGLRVESASRTPAALKRGREEAPPQERRYPRRPEDVRH